MLIPAILGDGLRVCIKAPLNSLAETEAHKEAHLLSLTSNRNIVQFLGIWDTAIGDEGGVGRLLVLELAMGSLQQRIEDTTAPLDQYELTVYPANLLAGLRHLHADLKVLHNDLKPGNLLLCHGHGVPVLKICDLGCAVLLSSTAPTEVARLLGGTPEFAPPEALIPYTSQTLPSPQGCTWQADMWSAGAVFHCMLFGTPIPLPFHRAWSKWAALPEAGDVPFRCHRLFRAAIQEITKADSPFTGWDPPFAILKSISLGASTHHSTKSPLDLGVLPKHSSGDEARALNDLILKLCRHEWQTRCSALDAARELRKGTGTAWKPDAFQALLRTKESSGWNSEQWVTKCEEVHARTTRQYMGRPEGSSSTSPSIDLSEQ